MFLLRLLSRLPLSVLFVLSDILFFFAYYVFRYRRDVVATNLKNSFPDKSDEERARIAKEFYRNLCDFPMELLKQLSMSREEMQRRYKMDQDMVNDLLKRYPSLIMFTSHQFNWEWFYASFTSHDQITAYYVYQEQSSKLADQFSNETRKKFGARGIKRDQLGRELIKLRGSRFTLAMVADQFPGYSHDKKFWTTFLNQETAFFYSAQQLTAVSQSPAAFFGSRKIKRGYYVCDIHMISEPPYSKDSTNVVEGYARAVEEAILRQPSGYLWTHKRWKRSRAEVEAESN